MVCRSDRDWLWVPPVSKRVSPRLPLPPARGAAESRDAPLRPCECELPRFTWHWADPYREEAVRAAREFLKLRKQCHCACRAGTTGVGVVRVGVGGNPGAQSALALRTLMTVPRILNHPGSTRIGLRVASGHTGAEDTTPCPGHRAQPQRQAAYCRSCRSCRNARE